MTTKHHVPYHLCSRASRWLVLLAAFVTLLMVGAIKPAQAQGSQICLDYLNLTICGDEYRDLIGSYQLRGNLTLGLKGGPPIVRVVDAAALPADHEYKRATFQHFIDIRESPWEAYDVLFGDIIFINDPKQRAPIGSGALTLNGKVFVGAFEVFADDGAEEIRAIVEAPPAYPPEPQKYYAQLFNQYYLDHLGLTAMYAEDATDEDRSQIRPFVHLQVRTFFGQLHIPKLRLFENAENPELPIFMEITMNEQGKYSGAATNFKMRMAGMTGEVKGIALKPGGSEAQQGELVANAADATSGTLTSAGFEAASIEFSRADNPSLPNLDPTNPNLVFRLESLKYKDGHFAVGGLVSVKDWQLGNAMRLTKQSVGLFTDTISKTISIIISSTLTFPARSVATDAGSYPMRIEIGARKVGGQFVPFGKGVLLNPNRPNLSFGVFSLGLPAATTFVMDPQRDFYGVEADKVSLTWKGNLGGQSGVETSFKIGMNGKQSLVFDISGGTIAVPQLRSGALTAQLAGTVNNANDTVTFSLIGTARLLLPGNSGVAPTAQVTVKSGKEVCAKICSPTYQMKLFSFELKVAGFTLGLLTPRGTEDGGFTVDTATLKVPVGISSLGGQINGLKVTGSGDISITGGSFELPPLQIGKVSFVGVKGSFIKTTTGGYEFRGAGVMPLPGLDPSGGPAGKKIAVDVVIRTGPTGDFTGMGVKVIFSTGSPGIPIAGSGMELLSISGAFDLNSGTAKISVGLRVGSTARIGSLPIATINANADLQINPLMFTANGDLSVLIFKIANAQLGVGAGQGFNGGSGFNVSFTVNQVIVHGEARLRIGQVTLTDGRRVTAFTAEATWGVGLKKNQFARFLPPGDIFISKKSFKGGLFRYKNVTEKVGLMTTVGCCFFFDATVFADFTDGFSVSFVDADDYKLFDETQVRAAAAAAESGFASQQVLASEVMGAEMLSAASLDAAAMVLQETIPVEIAQQANALFGIAYPAGAPILRLQRPDGTILSEEGVDNVTSGFIRYTGTLTESHELAFLLKDAAPGLYTMIIDNAPAEYEKVSYVLNQEPQVSDVTVTCGGEPVAGVTVTCNGAASGTTVNIGWNAADSDSITATVRVAYTAVLSDGISMDGTNQTVVAENLPLGAGSVTWDLADVPTGVYKMIVAVEDGQHAPVEVIAEPLIAVTDQRAPAVPGGLQAQPLPGEMLVMWTPNSEKDVAGYEIGFGVVDPALADDPSRFVYMRDMGAKEVELTTGNLLDAKLWGLTDNQEIFVGIRAYDRSGNVSAWSPLLRAIPWALSPAAWTPVPNGSSSTSARIEVAFETTLISETLASAIEVKAADGTVIPGAVEFISNLDGAVVGMSFVPATPLADGVEYTVTVKGGDAGIVASDGRRMLADYSWRFTALASLNNYVFLPVVNNNTHVQQ